MRKHLRSRAPQREPIVRRFCQGLAWWGGRAGEAGIGWGGAFRGGGGCCVGGPDLLALGTPNNASCTTAQFARRRAWIPALPDLWIVAPEGDAGEVRPRGEHLLGEAPQPRMAGRAGALEGPAGKPRDVCVTVAALEVDVPGRVRDRAAYREPSDDARGMGRLPPGGQPATVTTTSRRTCSGHRPSSRSFRHGRARG